MTPLCVLCLLPGLVGPATPATTARTLAAANAEAVRVTLIDPSLNAQAIELVRVQAGAGGIGAGSRAQFIFLDGKGARTTIDAGDRFPLAIAPDGWIIADVADLLAPRTSPTSSRPPSATAWIDLADGQRLIGSLTPPTAEGESQSVRWTHPRLGVQEIPLDRIRRLLLDAPELREALDRNGGGPAPTSDTIVLLNGDRITGYVDAIAAAATITPEPTAGAARPETVTIAIDQTAFIELSNPLTPRSGIMLYLADGSVIATDRLDIDAAAGRITLAARGGGDQPPTGPGGSLEFADLRAVALDAARLTSLSSLPLARHAPTGDRRIAEPPQILPVVAGSPSPLGADDILLRGPMLVEWILPPGASRIAGWITLEPTAFSWGDCTVTVSVIAAGESESAFQLTRQRINAARPIMPLNAELPAARAGDGARLQVTVEAGENGPVHDQVRLRRMLIATTPTKPPPR